MKYRIIVMSALAILLAYDYNDTANLLLGGRRNTNNDIESRQPYPGTHSYPTTQSNFYQEELQRNQLIEQQRKLQDLEFKQNHPEIYGR